MSLKVVYSRKTSDGNTIEVWEDGLVTAHMGHKIPGVMNKKVPSRSLALFAEEVPLFTIEELWALVEAVRRLGHSSPSPEAVRKLAMHILSLAGEDTAVADGLGSVVAGLRRIAAGNSD
jgi:hypothetical protein